MSFHVHSCLASFIVWVTTNTEQEMTPSLVSFCVRHHLLRPGTKWHPYWCHFMLSAFCMPYHAHQARNDTRVGVVSCSDPSLAPWINFEGSLLNILLFYYIFNSIYLIEYRACGNFAGIPHPWMWDRNSAGAGAGQPKSPHRTPVSITSARNSSRVRLEVWRTLIA